MVRAAVELRELIDEDLVVRRLSVKKQDVVFVKGIFEASEGLCAMFAERGGDLTVVAPASRAAELDVVLRDLVAELHGVLDDPGC
ncbi:MAG TPA: hypothetical protein VHV51_10105 [Polyangiaceae bacterium]|jgi:hypothetical protein|nr:hypothetical protein [Polyangiaceae bacterium]